MWIGAAARVARGASSLSPGHPSAIHCSMKRMSDSATRAPPHGSGGNCVPSNGYWPRNPRGSPAVLPAPGGAVEDELAGMLQHETSAASGDDVVAPACIIAMPYSLKLRNSGSGKFQNLP